MKTDVLDALINNAGSLIERHTVQTLNWDLMTKIFSLNTFSAMLMTRLCVPLLLKGTEPSIVRPEAIKALAEIGLDISGNRSKSVDEFAGRGIDYVLTVCNNAKENCPYFPAKTKLIHHAFEDPAGVEGDEETRVAAFRQVRDKIREYVPVFLEEIEGA